MIKTAEEECSSGVDSRSSTQTYNEKQVQLGGEGIEI